MACCANLVRLGWAWPSPMASRIHGPLKIMKNPKITRFRGNPTSPTRQHVPPRPQHKTGQLRASPTWPIAGPGPAHPGLPGSPKIGKIRKLSEKKYSSLISRQSQITKMSILPRKVNKTCISDVPELGAGSFLELSEFAEFQLKFPELGHSGPCLRIYLLNLIWSCDCPELISGNPRGEFTEYHLKFPEIVPFQGIVRNSPWRFP